MADTVVATKIAALSTVFEQCDQVRGLKRKLAEVTLELERVTIEKERLALDRKRLRRCAYRFAARLRSSYRAAFAASERARGASRIALEAAGYELLDARVGLAAAYIISADSDSDCIIIDDDDA